MQCAATCRASISVQEMAVEAALTGNRQLVKLAILQDPLTAAVLMPDDVWAMVDEMFEALAGWCRSSKFWRKKFSSRKHERGMK